MIKRSEKLTQEATYNDPSSRNISIRTQSQQTSDRFSNVLQEELFQRILNAANQASHELKRKRQLSNLFSDCSDEAQQDGTTHAKTDRLDRDHGYRTWPKNTNRK